MYILKNAFISLSRNRERNVLMGIIIAVIACSSAITLAIRNSANTLVESYVNKNDIIASISMNRENLMGQFKPGSGDENKEKFESIESLTEEEINSYGDSSYVKSYYYTYQISMNASNIEKAASETTDSNENFGPKGNRNQNMSDGNFTVIGYNSYDSMTDFIDGKYTITSGEVSSDFSSNNCVISNELATMNELEIGDTITLVDPNVEDKTYELTITGIYKEKSDNENMDMFSSSANTIITNNKVIKNIIENDDDFKARITPQFILTDKDVVDAFEEQLTEKGLSEYYQVTTNLDNIESETKSISNVKTFATTFLVITLIIGGVVLFILNMINVRERKYEIGVLRTIGMKKSLVVSQFVVELLVVAIIALLVGTAVGSVLSVKTANHLLENEITSNSEQMNDINKNFGQGNDRKPMVNRGFANMDKVTKINAVVDFKVILQLLAIGLSLTLVSSVASIVSISRFSPINILKERT